MKLCMFHPVDQPLERGWPGRIDGEHVVQLAAQTLQAFFTGGGTAREHAVYPLSGVRLLAPVLHPPSIRIFDDEGLFAFANPAAIVGPGATVAPPGGPSDGSSRGLFGLPRVAAVVGAGQSIAGFTVLAEWRADGLAPPKDRDFALGLGPVVVTADELTQPDDFDWGAAIALASANTTLYPGDLVAAPPREPVRPGPGGAVSVEIDGIGALEQRIAD